MSKYRVIQWGAGYTGSMALRYLIPNSSLELVGVRCYTAEKEGRDAGEIAGFADVGVRATLSVDDLLALDADCVLFMPRDALCDPSVPDSPSAVWVPELVRILQSGLNVVSPIASASHYKHMADGEGFRSRLEQACAEGNSTVFFTGFDPGFSDVLAFNMASAVGAIKRIDTWEIVDYGAYTAHDTLLQQGFGRRPEEVSEDAVKGVQYATWACMPHVIADGLGVEIERIDHSSEFLLCPEMYTAEGGLIIDEGTIAGVRFTVSGIVAGEPLINVNHVTRMGHHLAPEWPSIGRDGGYIVEIDSYPPFRGEFPMGLPGGGGTTLIDAMTMTAARCVNSVEATVNASPGYKLFHQLPPLSGRHGFEEATAKIG